LSALADSGSPVLDRVIENKELRIGMSGSQPPLNVKSRTGELIGFEVDLAQGISSALGAKAKIITMPFGDLLAALNDGKVDMVMSGMAITAERSTQASFIGPYLMSGKSILTKSDVLARASDSESFNRGDLKLAALANSTSQKFVEQVAPEATLVKVQDYNEAVEKLISGEIDALVADMPICLLTMLRYPNEGFVTTKTPLSVEPIGIAVPRNDPAFSELIRNYVNAYGKMGVMAKLRKKWFENDTWIAALP
jgi:polar amino acid transport system substrate-binding protein